MKYLCLISAERVMEDMSEADAAAHFAEYAEFTEDLKRGGHFAGANRLQPATAATTVRVRGGEVLVTDGPFAETREQIGGYYVIDAADLNEAIGIAARIPGARLGSVEIRPVAQDARTLALGFD